MTISASVTSEESALPTGDVAFLFTDIEGSTRLWEQNAAAMWRALEQHHALLRAAIVSHNGTPFKTIGDAFQAAFWSVADAVAAAVDAQRALAAAAWTETGPIRVRMAIHLGPAQPIAGDYTAPCLNRLARLLSTGYGGQVLLTELARRLAVGSLPSHVRLQDLGKHRLKDLLEPEMVTQLLIDGLPDHFPSLKSLERHPTNLPIQPTPLIGRESDLASLRSLLSSSAGVGQSRLLTLIGPGGAGKTRLALQVAADVIDHFDDGVFFVDLTPVTDPTSVLTTITQTLGVRETGGLSLWDALTTFLASKRLLLVVDNCEQVLSAAPTIAQLLAACPQVVIIATSRAPLRIRAEYEFAVEPLAVPDTRRNHSLAELAAVPAVELFIRRAEAAKHGFALTPDNAGAVAEICVRLDGLPLAIELAAARIKMLSPTALLQRLGRRLGLLTGGARDLPTRHQTLRDTIAWSYDLLREDEQTLFRRLGVFVGGARLDAIEAVINVSGDLDAFSSLSVLVDHSLIRQNDDEDGEPRFGMLETLREFAGERMASYEETTTVATIHADYFLTFAEDATAHLQGHDQLIWLARFDREHDNFRAALRTFGESGNATGQLRLAGSLALYWHMRGLYSEGRQWLETVRTVTHSPSPARLSALIGLGMMAEGQADFVTAHDQYDAGLALSREIGDRASEAVLLSNLAGVALEQGHLDRAAIRYDESLAAANAMGDRTRIATVMANMGALAHYRGDLVKARSHYEACLLLWRELGDQHVQATVLFNLFVLVAPFPQESERARTLGEEALAISQSLGDREGVALALGGLGLVAEVSGDFVRAIELHREALALFAELEDASGIARATGNLGLALLDHQEIDEANRQCRESLRGFTAIGDQDGALYALESMAMIACAVGRHGEAARWLGTAEARREDLGLPLPPESQRRHDHTLACLRAALPADALAAAWQTGRTTSMQEATAEALTTNYSPLVTVARTF